MPTWWYLPSRLKTSGPPESPCKSIRKNIAIRFYIKINLWLDYCFIENIEVLKLNLFCFNSNANLQHAHTLARMTWIFWVLYDTNLHTCGMHRCVIDVPMRVSCWDGFVVPGYSTFLIFQTHSGLTKLYDMHIRVIDMSLTCHRRVIKCHWCVIDVLYCKNDTYEARSQTILRVWSFPGTDLVGRRSSHVESYHLVDTVLEVNNRHDDVLKGIASRRPCKKSQRNKSHIQPKQCVKYSD